MCVQHKAAPHHPGPAELWHRGERRGKDGKATEMKKGNTVGELHRCLLCNAREHFQTAAARGEHHFAYENIVKLTRSLIRAFIIF